MEERVILRLGKIYSLHRPGLPAILGQVILGAAIITAVALGVFQLVSVARESSMVYHAALPEGK